MRDPVIMRKDYQVPGGPLLSQGISYEREAVKKFNGASFVENVALRCTIQHYEETFKRKLE